MDQKIPFTSYDFWAYLSAGFLLLSAVDHIANTGLLARNSWTVVQGVVAMSAAYAVGQLVASMSSWLFERLLVGRLLGYPRDTLFGRPKAWRWVQRCLPAYFQALPPETQSAALERGGRVGVATSGEALFWPAFSNARATPAVAARLDNFLNLYGFARNVALVAFIDSAILYWSYLQPKGPPEDLVYARIAVLVGAGMLLRYLKFFRLYANEVFTSFAYAKDREAEKK